MPATLSKDNEQLLVSLIKERVGAEVAECIKDQMAPFRELLDTAKGFQQAAQAEQIKRELDTDPSKALDFPENPEDDRPKREKIKNIEKFQAMVCALAAGKGDVVRAADWYHKVYGEDDVCKALAATDFTAGGALVPDQIAMDVIEFLRPMSVVRRMGPNILDMPTGVMRLPRITGGATGSYIGENQNITASAQTFGQVVANAKKLAVLVPISNDLIRRQSSSNTIVRDDVAASLAQTQDLKFIRSDGMNGEPKGLRYWAVPANRDTVNGTVNTENVLNDLGIAIQSLMENDTRMLRPGWLMAPRTWRALMFATTQLGTMVLRDEMINGRLLGYPYAITSQIPTNLAVTSSSESELYFADFADVVIAESTGLILDVSEHAYHDGSNVVSAFSQDQTVVRAITEHDLVVRHEESIHVFTDVDWGASSGITT